MTSSVQDQTTRPPGGFFGHPKGLSTLFFTETWERFSYYGMKAILLYYMYDQAASGGLGIDQGLAKSIVAVYGAALYMSSILGGWIADRFLGSRRSILYGGILIMLAHLTLAIPGGAAFLYASMVLLVIGTGMLKPNVTNSVGGLYAEDDTRRDAGFSIFYMGINLGAFLAPLVIGTIGQSYNYHLGFSLAAAGMAAGLTQYWLRRRTLGDVGLAPTNPMTETERGQAVLRIGIGVVLLVACAAFLVVTGEFTASLVVNAVSLLAFIVPVAYFVVMFTSKKVSAVERSRLVAYIPLFIGAVLFWFVEEQQFTVWAQFADQQTDLDAFGFHIPSSWVQVISAMDVIIFAPLLALLWTKLKHRQPSTPQKFTIGLFLSGLSFLIMALVCVLQGPDGKANPLWLLLSLTVLTIGELCLSPVGLSATTKLAPAAFVAQTVGLFLAADAAGQGLIAQVAPLYNRHSAPVYFGVIGGFVLVAAAILGLLSPAIKRKMHGVS